MGSHIFLNNTKWIQKFIVIYLFLINTYNYIIIIIEENGAMQFLWDGDMKGIGCSKWSRNDSITFLF